ncbi:MAG: hypothetical protein QNL04_10675 [SAR324 cluster bacterium]|nr:hypothetical protein [SAR324 cluster bacterium]
MIELRFLLEKVIKVELLGRSQTLKRFSIEEIFDALGKLKTELNAKGKTYEELYSAAFHQDIFALSLPREFGGKGLAESVSLLFLSEVASINAKLGFELLQSLATCKLLLHYNKEGALDPIIKGLIQGEIQGVMDVVDPFSHVIANDHTLTAKNTPKGWQVTGEKVVFYTPSQIAKLFLVPAKMENGKVGLFAIDEGGVKIDTLFPNTYLSPVEIEIDKDSDATLVAELAGEDIFSISSMRKHINLLVYSVVEHSYATGIEEAKRAKIRPCWLEDGMTQEKVTMINHPKVAESLMVMKSFRDGLRAMLFHSVFYLDCLQHGSEETADYFGELNNLFELVFKYYAPRKAQHLKRIARNIMGPRYFRLEDQHLLFQIDIMASNPLDLATHLVFEAFKAADGKAVNTLLSEFGLMGAGKAKTDELKEAINIWQDFVGGLFILNEEIQKTDKVEEAAQLLMHAERTIDLVGDVIVSHLLIKEALEAEKELQSMEVNFFALEQEALNKMEVRVWYNKILTALFFTRSLLAVQGAKIQMIQEGSLVPGHVFLEDH